jgi:hypothetical protein
MRTWTCGTLLALKLYSLFTMIASPWLEEVPLSKPPDTVCPVMLPNVAQPSNPPVEANSAPRSAASKGCRSELISTESVT